MSNSIDLSVDFEPTWTARVEIHHNEVTIRRNCEVPARDAEHAKERMTIALAVVWNDFRFLTEPTLKGAQQ